MATRPEAASSKAGACVSYGWDFADQYGAHRCLAYTGFLSGLSLGLALAHIDPEWATQAYDELVGYQDAVSGHAGMPSSHQRLETWKQAQALIRAAARRGAAQ